jgi:D-hydroxyproline dehydrogenase subunit gamma
MNRRLPAVTPQGRGEPFTLTVDDVEIPAYPGETIAAAVAAAGRRTLRSSPAGRPRGLYCGIGLCGECGMTVDGRPSVRVCVEPAAPGSVVTG